MNLAGQFPQYAPISSRDTGADAQPLLQLRDFLSRQWRLIALVTALSIVVGTAYLAVTPSKYTAQADMIIDTKRVTWTQSELATENRMVEDASVESEIETTKSEKVALSVIRRLHLNEDPEFIGTSASLKQRILKLLKLAPAVEPEPSEEQLMRRALWGVKDNLRVLRLGRSYIEQIAFTSLDPDKAARIANAFADAYIEDQLQAKFEATRRASAWLEQRIGELRQQASDAYKEVQDFKSKNSIIIGVDGKLASEVELDQLGIALAKARADTSQARAKLDRITRVIEQRNDNSEKLNIPDPVVTDALSNPVITKLRQQFLDDQSRESEWSARYGADHQAARNLRAEMAALQRAIWDEISRISESYRSELQIAKTQEESIDKRMIEVFQQSASTRNSQVRLRELETAANTYRGIYETFLSRFTQSVQQQSRRVGAARQR
jgi:polysaccharide biosynthesis transport protein